MYRLTFLNGPMRGRRLTVRQGSVRVGRNEDCHVRLVGEGIAGEHARLEERESGIVVQALSAEHPVQVNGRPVTEQLLHPGDRLRIGPFEMGFLRIQAGRQTQARRVSKVQGLTIAAIVVIIVVELALLIGFGVLHGTSLGTPETPPAETPAPEEPAAPEAPPQGETPAPEPAPEAAAPEPTDTPVATPTEPGPSPAATVAPAEPSEPSDGVGVSEGAEAPERPAGSATAPDAPGEAAPGPVAP